MQTTNPKDFRLDAPFRVGAWYADPALNELTANGRSVHVEPKVMHVLLCLARRQGSVVSRESLLQSVWGGVVVTDQVLSRSISVLRKILGDDSRQPTHIQTVPKHGYRLIAHVEPIGIRPDRAATGYAREAVAVAAFPFRQVVWVAAVIALGLYAITALVHTV